MAKKIYVKTMGCQMNEYDSSRIVDALAYSHQMALANQPEEADLILLNTCSIREKAQEKVFSELGRWRSLKQKRPGLVIGVGGCVASQEGGTIRERAPYVDIVFGPQTLHRLPEMYDTVIKQKKAVVDITFPAIEKFDRLPTPRAKGPIGSVSIMEGCSKYCSFCVVPYTRGEEVSRDFDDVITEVVDLAEQGVKDITLLGQNVNAYRGRRHDGRIADLALLIQYIAALDEIKRIHFTTSHPLEFSDRLIDTYRTVPKLVSHLHLPVQSGSDRILAMMKRNHTILEYKHIIRKVYQARPGISISSDFIVGFPGESDADFEQTLKLIDELGFDHSFSFIYSPRPGTPAANLPDNTPMEVKKQRLYTLQHKIRQNATAISRTMLGTHQVVLVEGHARKNTQELSGRTSNNRVVNFAGSDSLIGQSVTLEISKVLPNSLRGTLLN